MSDFQRGRDPWKSVNRVGVPFYWDLFYVLRKYGVNPLPPSLSFPPQTQFYGPNSIPRLTHFWWRVVGITGGEGRAQL